MNTDTSTVKPSLSLKFVFFVGLTQDDDNDPKNYYFIVNFDTNWRFALSRWFHHMEGLVYN